jgi:hypothetical protein
MGKVLAKGGQSTKTPKEKGEPLLAADEGAGVHNLGISRRNDFVNAPPPRDSGPDLEGVHFIGAR